MPPLLSGYSLQICHPSYQVTLSKCHPFGESVLIRGMAFGESGMKREVTFGERGLIRGVAFGESDLIRGMAFGESCHIRWGLLNINTQSTNICWVFGPKTVKSKVISLTVVFSRYSGFLY
jgi:hypothetical protein